MTRAFALVVAACLAAPTLQAQEGSAVRAAIAAAVTARMGEVSVIEVVIEQGNATADAASAEPLLGARLGRSSGFTIVGRDGRSSRVMATVRATAAHAVARRAISRGTTLTDAEIDWRDAALDGAALQRLPSRHEVFSARNKRALAAGELLTSALLQRDPDIKAGDEITITLRTGAIEAVGPGRAASSGSIGDVIRVTRPGSRTTQRARVVSATAVEMIQ